MREPGHDLVKDNVDPGHILPVQRPKIMAVATPKPSMGIHILDDMPDILHAMGAAPLTQLHTKCLLVQPGHSVHIGDTDLMGFIPHGIP